jgi:CheY-like chemotaxis protein
VVDDNATNRRILNDILQSWRMQVTAAADGPQALATLFRIQKQGERIPLVITDVNMPAMDGFQLAERIRESAQLGDTLIIMLTSGSRAGDMGRCQELGVAAHLMKPVKQSELLNAIMLAVGAVDGEVDVGQTVGEVEMGAIGGLQVLLAEDGIANQKLAVGLLERWGHRVTIANNGKEAVGLQQSQPFDLVLMDVQMPEMDGLEATRVIRDREQETGTHVPIIAMTARALKGDREKCLDAGMDGYVSKPVRKKELEDAIREFFPGPERETGDATAVVDPGSDAGENAVNWEAALETVEGDRKLLQSVVEVVLQECPSLLDDLENAIRSDHGEAMKRAAHTLRGSMRLFDVPSITELTSDLESIGESGDLQRAAEQCAALKQVFQTVLPELTRFAQS